MSQPSRFPSWLIALLCLLAFSFSAHSQTAVDGAIGGTITDNSGAVVSGAHIAVRNTATNAEQTAIADSSGYFRIIHLAPRPL
jgi:hypothetical protein